MCNYLRNRYRQEAMKKARNSSWTGIPIGFRQNWFDINGLYSSGENLE